MRIIGRYLAGVVLCVPVLIWLATVRGDERPFRIWTSRTFLDRREGLVPDSGANLYVTADGSIRLLDVRDLNHDGRVDIVLANTHENNEKLPLNIYFGADSFHHPVSLPTDGGKAGASGTGGDPAIPARYHADWIVVDTNRFDVRPPWDLVYRDARFALYHRPV